MFSFTPDELVILKALSTPSRIQDFIDTLAINFEEQGDTCMSPRRVLREKKAHCMEAAMLAAVALRLQGKRPLLVDLTATKKDFDHVIAVFQHNGLWGATSKSNRAHLRYRDPVYSTVREIVLSYFNEYFLDDGTKTLRSYSDPVDLSQFDDQGWMTAEEDIWYIPEHLAEVKHFPILSREHFAMLRKADGIEVAAGKLKEWVKTKKGAEKNNFIIEENASAEI